MKSLTNRLFTLRSYTPIPFVITMIIFASPNYITMSIGFVLVAFGEWMRFWGVAYAGSLTRVTGKVGAPDVIVSGPFAYVRNPLYIGNMFTYIGIGIMSNAIFPWLVIIAAVYFTLQYHLIVLTEEEFLEKEFGQKYLDYKKNVPRFIPLKKKYLNQIQQTQLPNWQEAVTSERRTFQALGLILIILLILWYAR